MTEPVLFKPFVDALLDYGAPLPDPPPDPENWVVVRREERHEAITDIKTLRAALVSMCQSHHTHIGGAMCICETVLRDTERWEK